MLGIFADSLGFLCGVLMRSSRFTAPWEVDVDSEVAFLSWSVILLQCRNPAESSAFRPCVYPLSRVSASYTALWSPLCTLHAASKAP